MNVGRLEWLLVVGCLSLLISSPAIEGVEVEVSSDGSVSSGKSWTCDLSTVQQQFLFSNPADDQLPPHAVFDKLPLNQQIPQTNIFQAKESADLMLAGGALIQNVNNGATSRYSSWSEAIASSGTGTICHNISNPGVDTDTVFAAQRFNGIVSQLINRLDSESLSRFPSLTENVQNDATQIVRRFDRRFNFKKELEAGNLYYIWYRELEGLKAAEQDFSTVAGKPNVPNVPRYLPLPLAVFRFADQELHPVLIQLYHNAAWYTYYPATEQDKDYKKWSWQYAKLAVHAAEFNYHEAVKHSATTHFVLDPIIVATNRELCPDHPVFQLISPHWDKTLTINQMVRSDTTMSTISALDNPTRLRLISRGFANYGFRDFQIINDLTKRGFHVRTDRKGRHHLDDEFEFYSYAQDQLALWDAIYEFVEDVIKSQYRSNLEVASDVALNNWAYVLATQVRIHQFPEVIQDIPTLVNTVTHIIWTATGLHASINYPQAWFFCTANYVGALYAPPPDPHDKSISESYVLSALPPIALNNLVTAVMAIGSTPPGQFVPNKTVTWVDTLLYQYSQQGYHNVLPSQSVPVVPSYIQNAIPDFERHLSRISDEIKKRESNRQHSGNLSYRKYWFVDPKNGIFLADAIYL